MLICLFVFWNWFSLQLGLFSNLLFNEDDVSGGQPPGATQEIETYRGGNSYTLYKSDQNPLNFARCVSGFMISTTENTFRQTHFQLQFLFGSFHTGCFLRGCLLELLCRSEWICHSPPVRRTGFTFFQTFFYLNLHIELLTNPFGFLDIF